MEFQDCLDSNFSSRTLNSWSEPIKISDPSDRRIKLFNFELLHEKYRKQIIERFGDVYKYYWSSRITNLITTDTGSFAQLIIFKTPNGKGLDNAQKMRYSKACNVLRFLVDQSPRKIKDLGFASTADFYDVIIDHIKNKNIALPGTYAKLKAKEKEFKKEGFKAVIPLGRYNNNNSEKIAPEVENWFIKQMCSTRISADQVFERKYLSYAEKMGWTTDITAEAFIHRMNKPENKQTIDFARLGKKAYLNRYGQQFNITRAIYADDLWVGDGTKVDLYFQDYNRVDSKGKKLKSKKGIATVYVVMDALSYKMVGYSMRNGLNKENYEMQLEANRMALRQNGWFAPYQSLYDNQGGHKKTESKNFYDKLTQVHFPTRAYRSASKPIESAFGRFQRMVLADLPFWTGFGRHTHSNEQNAPNKDEVDRHFEELPTYDELIQLIEVLINEWNNMPHPEYKGKSHAQVYDELKDPEAEQLSLEEYSELFWDIAGPKKYQKEGIEMTFNGHDEWFEVYTPEGDVDYDFRMKNLKKKFYVKYDPDREYPDVELYEPLPNGDMRLVATAEPKRKVNRSARWLKEGEKQWISGQMAGEDELIEKLKEKAASVGYDEDEKWNNWRNRITKAVPEDADITDRM